MMGWQWHQLDHMQSSATHSRQITTPTPHHLIFYRPDALPDAQLTMSEQKLEKMEVEIVVIMVAVAVAAVLLIRATTKTY